MDAVERAQISHPLQEISVEGLGGKVRVVVLGNRILVRPAETPERTPGGVWLPQDAQRRQQYAQVVNVGVAVTEDIHAGDVVFFPMYVGQEIKLPSDDEPEVLIVMDVKNIVGKLVPT